MKIKGRILEVGSDGHHPYVRIHVQNIDDVRGLGHQLYEYVDIVRPYDVDSQVIELLTKDLECVHMFLDDRGVKRKDEDGNDYSIVGRLKTMLQFNDQRLVDVIEANSVKDQRIVHSCNDCKPHVACVAHGGPAE